MNRSPIHLHLSTAAVFLLVSCSGAGASEATSIMLPWGDTVLVLAQIATSVLVPLAIAAITGAVARIAGPLRLLVTTALVERLVRNVSDYAINAVAGGVRGRVLTVPLGSAVIAEAVQRALDQAPAWLIAAAGGPKGVAEKVFRSLPLDGAADADNTLVPALRAVAFPQT